MSDLNREIAELLGKTVVMWQAEDDLWIQETSHDGLIVKSPCPHYDTDLNSLTAAIEAAGYDWQIERRHYGGMLPGIKCTAAVWEGVANLLEHHPVKATADTAALALATAFRDALKAREEA